MFLRRKKATQECCCGTFFPPTQKRTEKKKPAGYLRNPVTIGDHIRKVRIDRKLTQEEVGKLFMVSTDTVSNWELNRYSPHVSYYKVIIEFLGYYPFSHETESLAGKILKYRYIHGLTHRQMGRKIGVNATAIGAWEIGENKPQAASLWKLQKILNDCSG